MAVSCCRQAAAAGHEVTLLLLTEPEGHFDEYATFYHESLGLPAKSPSAPGALVEWLKRNPQDVLFVNDCSPAHPALPYIPNGTKSVFVVHDTARQYWGPAARSESVLDGIVTVSDVIARQFRDRLNAPEKVRVLHNGTIFPEDVGPLPSHERDPDLLFLGGDKPFKGAEDVLDLWPKLTARGFEGSLYWYGRIEPSFASRIKALPRANRIVAPGRVPRSVIFDRAARASAILVPSRVEPFGMVTVEGMGMGTIPIAWDIKTGTQEIVSPGDDGMLVPLGNTDAMAEAVFEVLASHEHLAEQAIAKARKQFSEAAMWQRYADFLDTLQTQPTSRRPNAGTPPPSYKPPRRYFQLLPVAVRASLRDAVARSPKLSYWLRDWRGL